MKVLLVKTSSLGDLIHSMPAITELAEKQPEIELHWLVEEGFANIPLWHPFVKKVHCSAIRRWRKSLFSKTTRNELKQLKQSLLDEQFDLVLDAQGLIKTAFMVRWLACPKIGLDKHSIKEPLASRVYDKKIAVAKGQNAIIRVKQLFAEAFDYQTNSEMAAVDFGLDVKKPEAFALAANKPYVVCLHGTNWPSKIWPELYWQTLAESLIEQGFDVLFPFGDANEKQRAERITTASNATLLPKCSLDDLAYLISKASVVIGSDTGLSHIAAALAVPVIGLYGSTDSVLTGLVGKQVLNLQSSFSCSPCLKRECPLIEGDQIIPCYQSIGVPEVLTAMKQVVEKQDVEKQEAK
jgi:heptosyltransferase-1